ncbi:hypothetical protein BaRGS_00021440, partial [Batillaria attramentaria]
MFEAETNPEDFVAVQSAYVQLEPYFDSGVYLAQDASPANDELEFVKIGNRTPSRNNHSAPTTRMTHNFDNHAFISSDREEDDNSILHRAYRHPPGPRPFEQPPSYDTTMRNANLEAETRAANMYYASDRQSVRSK